MPFSQRDVSSLYPNIDLDEAIEVRSSLLTNAKKQNHFVFLCRFIRFVLESNTMNFGQKFYHQTEGCAMRTTMAVNFANFIFMRNFDEKLLEAFELENYQEQDLRLCFIDDIFFLLVGKQEGLLKFLQCFDTFA